MASFPAAFFQLKNHPDKFYMELQKARSVLRIRIKTGGIPKLVKETKTGEAEYHLKSDDLFANNWTVKQIGGE